ncbi:MAG: histidine phosphatase family protein [Actinomycetia bacterium]|nr:histidine phosphatase family protein [Actinomycetes bacterium]
MTGRLVLLRHGQTHGNVDRRLDTRPPGAELTDLGRDQARAFARSLPRPPALIAHSIATRAVQTAHHISAEINAATNTDATNTAATNTAATISAVGTFELEGIHEVQVGELENRSDEAAHEDFKAIYRRWHGGELGLALPGGETAHHVLDRYLPVLEELRTRYLDDHTFHGDIVVVSHGAAIRLVSAVLAGVDGRFAIDHHLSNAESVVLAPSREGRWSCLRWGSFSPPFGTAAAATGVRDQVRSADPMG